MTIARTVAIVRALNEEPRTVAEVHNIGTRSYDLHVHEEMSKVFCTAPDGETTTLEGDLALAILAAHEARAYEAVAALFRDYLDENHQRSLAPSEAQG